MTTMPGMAPRSATSSELSWAVTALTTDNVVPMLMPSPSRALTTTPSVPVGAETMYSDVPPPNKPACAGADGNAMIDVLSAATPANTILPNRTLRRPGA